MSYGWEQNENGDFVGTVSDLFENDWKRELATAMTMAQGSTWSEVVNEVIMDQHVEIASQVFSEMTKDGYMFVRP